MPRRLPVIISSRASNTRQARLHLERLEDRLNPGAGATNLAALNYVPGYVIAHVANPANSPATSAASSVSPNTVAHLPTGSQDLGAGLFLVPVPEGMTVAAAVPLFASLPGIDSVTPDYLLSASSLPNDPSFGSQWALSNSGQSNGKPGADIHAPQAWNVTTGTGKTVIGVIDTGIDYNSPDLYLNIWINQQAIPADVRSRLIDVDGDGVITFRDLNDPRNQGPGKITDLNHDGRIDAGDILMPVSQGGWSTGPSDDLIGYNFAGNNNDPIDTDGHGTHVAGTTGAPGNNGVGVAGVDWNVQLMPLKFMGADGTGSLADAIRALNYAVAHGARITNNSYGGADSYQPMADAIAAARSAGTIVVTAAGNNGKNDDVTPWYPASYNSDNVVAVAATDRNDQLASFSDYGPKSVDLAAPGVSILSTLPNGAFGNYSGTSMAAAFATGALALVWDAHPDWSYNQVIAQVLGTVDSVPSLTGKVETGGRLDVGRALTESVPLPAAAPASGGTSTAFAPSSAVAPSSNSGATAGSSADWQTTVQQQQELNRQIIATFTRLFSGPFPAGSSIVGGGVTSVSDVNGDGIPDISGYFVLNAGRNHLMVIQLTFDGLSPAGNLIGQPVVTLVNV